MPLRISDIFIPPIFNPPRDLSSDFSLLGLESADFPALAGLDLDLVDLVDVTRDFVLVAELFFGLLIVFVSFLISFSASGIDLAFAFVSVVLAVVVFVAFLVAVALALAAFGFSFFGLPIRSFLSGSFFAAVPLSDCGGGGGGGVAKDGVGAGVGTFATDPLSAILISAKILSGSNEAFSFSLGIVIDLS